MNAATSAAKRKRPPDRAEVVEAIRQRIFRGDLVPGQRLVEAELCETFGITRATVRAALVDLDHSGLVERIANRSARVRVVDLKEALQLAELRMVVEGLCVSKAAENVTDDDIVELRGLADDLVQRARNGDVAGWANTTSRILATYIRIADRPVAAEMLARLRAQNARHRFRLTYRGGRTQAALPYWLERIEAICARDPEAAVRSVYRHGENVQAAMRALAEADAREAAQFNGEGGLHLA